MMIRIRPQMPTEPVVEKKKGTFESVKANMQLA
jgi:hypothetical protein